MTPGGLYAEYQGITYPVQGSGRDFVFLSVGERNPDELQGPGIIDRLRRPEGNKVKVHQVALGRFWSRKVLAEWRGAEVWIEDLTGPQGDIAVYYTLAGPQWARENGAEGSQHDGWWGDAPLSELTDIRVEEKDLPLEGEAR